MNVDVESSSVSSYEEIYQKYILGDNRVVDAKNWFGHEEQINQLFTLYKEKVNPLISVYNSLENKFPIGVVNELRDIFSHLTQSLQVADGDEVNRHLDKAHRHLKRATVDAFKYASMAYAKVYDDFKESYRHVDLSYVDNGQFLPKLVKLNTEAEKLMHDARMVESGIHEDEEMYVSYEAAFDCYAGLYACIMDSLEAAETIRLKADEDNRKKRKERRTDRTIGIVGILVGIIGIFVGFLV